MEKPVRVCLIEDDDDDFVVTRDLLRESRHTRFQLDRAATYEEGVDLLQRGAHDVYLIDYRLGAHTGLELVRAFATARFPLIVFTGSDDPDTDVQAMHAGAMDYLVKGQTNAALLERSIRYSIARKRTEESLRHKDEFLAMLGHELRNPLAPIRTALHILDLPQATPQSVQRSKQVLHRQVNHLVRLVDDLLDVSRIVLRRIELRKEQTALMDVVHHAIDTAEPVIEASGQQLDVEVRHDGARVLADPVRLAQAITNLLVNAARHNDRTGRILVTVDRDDENAIIRVRDWGVGIPPDLLPRIFDLFVQGERSLARSEGGLGVGLSLVKAIVDLHGGTVQAHSDGPGSGSEFVIRLPLSDDAPVAVPSGSDAAAPTTAPRRVLVVDDNVDAAESIAVLLQLKGHRVDVAHDGYAAVDVAKRQRPDLILLDIGLPGRDGYQVARLLRADPDFAHTQIVALTGYGQQDDRRRSIDAGMDDHLTKPVAPERLDTILRQH